MHKFRDFLGILLILFIAASCKKSPELETEYLPIFSNNVEVNVSKTQIGLKAFFTQQNTSSNENIGFEWSEKDGTKTTMFNAGATNSGEFALQIDTVLQKSNIYKVRAWIKVGEKMFYSNYTYFSGLGYPPPVITSLSKNYAFRGDLFSINGKYFTDNSTTNGIVVKIDNILCKVISASFNKISVIMPQTKTVGKLKITLTAFGKSAAEDFEIENYQFVVYSVSPQSISFDGEITIKGKFHSEYVNNIFPMNSNRNRYKIMKYTDDEIIIRLSDDMDGDDAYCIIFYISPGEGPYDYEVLNTGYCVQHTGNWHIVNNLPFSTEGYAVNSLSCNGYGYIICFKEFPDDFNFWKFDPVTVTWTKLATFPGVYRNYCVFVESKGLIYCGSGRSQGNGILSDFWQFDPATNTWTRCADLKFKSGDNTFVFGGNIQDTLYVFSTLNNQKAKYNPASKTWQISDCVVPELNDSDKHMFVYNGNYYFQGLSSFYQYDLESSSFILQYTVKEYTLYGTVFSTVNKLFMNSGFTNISELDLVNKEVTPHKELSNYLNQEYTRTYNLFTLNDIPYFLVYRDKMCKLTLNQ